MRAGLCEVRRNLPVFQLQCYIHYRSQGHLSVQIGFHGFFMAKEEPRSWCRVDLGLRRGLLFVG